MYCNNVFFAYLFIMHALMIVNHEESSNGLLIVRAQDPMPSQSQTAAQPRSLKPSSNSHQPPSKKFKADTQNPLPLKPSSQTRGHQRVTEHIGSDVEVEKDVRAMDDEADKLRRLSRARTTIDPSILQSKAKIITSSRFETPQTGRKGKRPNTAVDIVTPLPDHDTPKIQRNKQMRSNVMGANANGRHQTVPETETPTTTPGGSRRKSSVSGRGKRVSSSFELSGIISKFSFRYFVLLCSYHGIVSTTTQLCRREFLLQAHRC